MKKLLKKYDLKIQDLMLMASLENWTKAEISDKEYIEDRVRTIVENGWNIYKNNK